MVEDKKSQLIVEEHDEFDQRELILSCKFCSGGIQ